MGPRSEDRGKDPVATPKPLRLSLQWGRGPKTTERSWSRHGPSSAEASMGPRSEDHGKIVRVRVGNQASMGPRSEDRGKKFGNGQWDYLKAASMGPRSQVRN